MDIDQLEEAFHEKMRQIYEESKEFDYQANYFIQMVEEMGGLGSSKTFAGRW